jgi:hypothetical protein
MLLGEEAAVVKDPFNLHITCGHFRHFSNTLTDTEGKHSLQESQAPFDVYKPQDDKRRS